MEFLEVIDQFLMAMILRIFVTGFYQLFLNPQMPFESWLKVNTVHDLEGKLMGVLITQPGVTGLGYRVTWDGTSELLSYSVSANLLIAALSYYAVCSKQWLARSRCAPSAAAST